MLLQSSEGEQKWFILVYLHHIKQRNFYFIFFQKTVSFAAHRVTNGSCYMEFNYARIHALHSLLLILKGEHRYIELEDLDLR